MKKSLLVMLLFTGLLGWSQEGEQREGMSDMSPEQIATLQTKKMTLDLNLNKEQQEKIQELHLENAKVRKEKRAEHKTRKGKGKPNPDELYAQKNDRLDRAISFQSKMRDILSKDQYAKWEKMHEGRMHHAKGKHKAKGQK